jgi:histo-blood group ABO system transferase
MRTALLIIATGEKYHKYVQPLLLSARDYFVPHTAVVFSDVDDVGYGERPYMKIPHEEWPGPTLHRYHTFLKAKKYLNSFDNIYYLDADMLIVAPIGDEIFSSGILAVQHPGYVNERGTPDRNPSSLSFMPHNAMNEYFCGGFNGGESAAFLSMAEELAWRIDADTNNGVLAIWNDESHLNRYLHENPPTTVLDPSYCYPENASAHYTDKWKAAGLNVTPKILALDKGKR